jgi:hypothetical protein
MVSINSMRTIFCSRNVTELEIEKDELPSPGILIGDQYSATNIDHIIWTDIFY